MAGGTSCQADGNQLLLLLCPPKCHREEEEQEKEEEKDEEEIPVDSSGLFISIVHPRNMRPQSLRPRLEEQEEQKRTGVG